MIKRMIQRIIVGVSVALILSFIYSKVDAEEYGNIKNVNIHTNFPGYISSYAGGTIHIISNQYIMGTEFFETGASNNVLANAGKGFFIFSFAYYTDRNYSSVINSVSIKSGGDLFACDIGNLEPYSDSVVQWKQATAKCYVNLGSYGIERIRVQVPYQPPNVETIVQLSRYGTFVGASTPTSNQDVVNAITTQTALQQQELQTQREIKQAIQEQTAINQQQLEEQQNTNNLLNDDTPVSNEDVSSNVNDWSSNNANNGVINQLVQMPITLLNGVVSGLSGTCTPYNFGSLFGSDLIFPCIDLSEKLGSLWVLIDTIISGVFIFLFGGRCVKMFNDFTNLRSGQIDQLYGGGN